MVCKINFDFEVVLSDENDSTSSIDSCDQESYGYKFVLGDNIAYTTPLEIISVRQSKDCSKTNSDLLMIDEGLLQDNYVPNKIPMNSYVHYDKSINNSEEESVVDSEEDSFFVSAIHSIPNELHSPLLPLKYELPIVNKFQLSPSPVTKRCQNINSITEYCLNEKYRRFQLEINSKKLQSEKILSKQTQESHNVNLESKIIPVINSKPSDTPPNNNNDENTIPFNMLSSLPIDLLTDFINGDKSAKEIISGKQCHSTKKLKKHKKPKQDKVDKKTKTKSNKNCSRSVTAINSPETGNNVNKELDGTLIWSTMGNHRSSMEHICSMDTLSSENVQKEMPIPTLPKIISNEPIPKEAHKDNKIQQSICRPKVARYKKHRSINLRYQTDNDTGSIDQTDYSVTNSKTPDVHITESIMPNKRTPESPKKGNNYVKHEDDQDSSISSLPPMKCLVMRREMLSNSPDTSIATDVTHTIFDEKPHSNHTCTYPVQSSCNDNRTPSTDSGFDEMGSRDPTEYFLSNEKLFLNQESKDLRTRTELRDSPNYTSTNATDNPSKSVSINDFLNLSSFKFHFINESELLDSNPDLVRGKSEEIGTTALKIDIEEISTPKALLTQTDKPCQETMAVAHSNWILENRNQAQISNPNNQSIHLDLQCPKQIEHSIHYIDAKNTNGNADENITKNNPVPELTGNRNTENETIRPSHCNPFKINYWSTEAAINNHEEISQFLTFQWLKFCEKYTISKYNSMNL